MNIQLRYFAVLREKTGVSAESIVLPDDSSVNDAFEAVCALHPDVADHGGIAQGHAHQHSPNRWDQQREAEDISDEAGRDQQHPSHDDHRTVDHCSHGRLAPLHGLAQLECRGEAAPPQDHCASNERGYDQPKRWPEADPLADLDHHGDLDQRQRDENEKANHYLAFADLFAPPRVATLATLAALGFNAAIA